MVDVHGSGSVVRFSVGVVLVLLALGWIILTLAAPPPHTLLA